ncbi:MAG: response regulator [Methylophaga sp.]|nr:response regulator [Methylophaga sp.]
MANTRVMTKLDDSGQLQGEILVVDDTSANLKLLVDLLIANNYKVRPASDGQQALNAVEKRKPDLILLDIMMPNINGYEVCRCLKENESTRDIPIIFISALDALEDRIKGFDMGGVDYITKPIESKEVLARVRTHMQLHNLQVNLEAIVEERTLKLQEINEELQHSYHRLEWAEKIGHLGNWEWNIATNELYLSDEVFRIVGVEPQSLKWTHDDYIGLIHPDDKENVSRVINDSLYGGNQSYSSEHRIIQTNGSIRFIYEQGRVNCDDTGAPISLVATVLDITERKLAHQKEHQDAAMMHEMMLQTIQAISTTVEKRDPYTAGHQQRVADLSVAIAQEMKLDSVTIEGIKLGALIHDIGKIYLPAEILSRPGILTEIEFEMIKTHSKVGFDIIKNVDFPWPVANMILQHHERLDGTGYPQGLKADDIILEAKIISVADVVEAMASHRPYRVSPGLDAALEEIQKGSGIRYDTEVVQCCILLFKEKDYSLPNVNVR